MSSCILLGLTGWCMSQITVILELGVSKTVRYTSYNASDLQKWRVLLNNEHGRYSAKHAISHLRNSSQISAYNIIWQFPKTQRNTPPCFQRTCLNQLQLKISVRSVRQRWTPLLNWAAEFLLSLAMSGRVHTYSNAFLWRYSASTRCFCTILLLLTYRTYTAFLWPPWPPYGIGQAIILFAL